jgi:hypothetical protein
MVKKSPAKKTSTKKAAPKPAAKPKGTKPAAGAAAPLADAHVDPAALKTYEDLVAELKDADSDAMHGWDRKYEAAGEILDKKLFLLSPHGTADKWCRAMLGGEPLRSVQRNARVAKYCSPNEETKYGTAKLDAVLTYLDAQTHGFKSGPLKVDLAALRIPAVVDKKKTKLSIEEATIKQILAAARGEEAGAKQARTPLEQGFASALAGDADLKEVSIRITDGRVSFGRVPLTALLRFVKAVREVDWEAIVHGDD